MASKTDTEVLIGGKVFTLSGYESEEYLQRVAAYINSKMAEYKCFIGSCRTQQFKHVSPPHCNIKSNVKWLSDDRMLSEPPDSCQHTNDPDRSGGSALSEKSRREADCDIKRIKPF